jgi:hypothetical protein
MGSLKMWFGVPDGSKLAVAVTADEDVPFASGARLIEDEDGDATEVSWSQSDISPGPKSVNIRAGRSYSVRVRVGHLSPSPSDVLIAAQVVLPNGEHYGTDYEFVVTGQRGDDPRRATIIAVAEASS